jgi:hypothetical protein
MPIAMIEAFIGQSAKHNCPSGRQPPVRRGKHRLGARAHSGVFAAMEHKQRRNRQWFRCVILNGMGLLVSLCSRLSSDMPSASGNRGYAAAVTITMIEAQLAAALSVKLIVQPRRARCCR